MQEEAVAAAQDTLYRAILYAYCPLHIVVLCGLCHLLRWGAAFCVPQPRGIAGLGVDRP